MASDNWNEQLMSLKALTALTGILHEAQVFQLKMWGAVVFNGYVGSGNWEAVVTDDKTVTFNLTPPPKSKMPSNQKKIMEGLYRSIHWLLGDEWAVIVQSKGKTIFKGARMVSPEKKKNEQRKQRTSRFSTSDTK